MKRFLFIPFLLTYLHAGAVPETKTTGSLGLLRPSTTTPDANRNSGDKLNSNFQIIDSSFSTLMTQVISSTNSLYNALTSTSVQLSNFINSANSTMTALSGSTNTLGNLLAQRTVVGYNGGSALGGNITAINTSGLTAALVGSTLTLTATAGGISSLNGSTYTAIIKVPNVIFSTITPYGIPGAYFSAGASTYTIYSWSAFCLNPSTVGWVKFDALFSTGGVNGLPLAPSRYSALSLSTGSVLGVAGYGTSGATTVVLNAYETFGVGISSFSVSGNPGAGCSIRLRISETSPFP